MGAYACEWACPPGKMEKRSYLIVIAKKRYHDARLFHITSFFSHEKYPDQQIHKIFIHTFKTEYMWKGGAWCQVA